MNTPAQLRLAADILETGHPYEYRNGDTHGWCPGHRLNPAVMLTRDGHSEIRLALATPPDGRPLHNPDDLTAEQVGAGYRLALAGEKVGLQGYYWSMGEWVPSAMEMVPHLATFRLPLSVPWPEPVDPFAELKKAHAAGKVIQAKNCDAWCAIIGNPDWTLPVEYYRIKPDAPPFQLPPPPPGMSWHRMDAWKADDLPQGYRPTALGEEPEKGDECFSRVHRYEEWEPVSGLIGADEEDLREHIVRTTRPLTFEHAGKQWTWHRPGDPMPAKGGSTVVSLLLGDGTEGKTERADLCIWSTRPSEQNQIIGWRYAEPATKEVELGPEDVPPGSVLRRLESKDFYADEPGEWAGVVNVDTRHGCTVTGLRDGTPTLCAFSWAEMKEGCQINRPRHRDADGNPTLWEPCSKTIPA